MCRFHSDLENLSGTPQLAVVSFCVRPTIVDLNKKFCDVNMGHLLFCGNINRVNQKITLKCLFKKRLLKFRGYDYG